MEQEAGEMGGQNMIIILNPNGTVNEELMQAHGINQVRLKPEPEMDLRLLTLVCSGHDQGRVGGAGRRPGVRHGPGHAPQVQHQPAAAPHPPEGARGRQAFDDLVHNS